MNPQPARVSTVLSKDSFTFVPDHPSEPGSAVEVAVMLGPGQGAQHLSIALVRLLPGASIRGHVIPFEESFYVLEGSPQVTIADKQFALAPQDFGVVPTAHGHAWSNPGSEAALVLRVHTPQPRPIGGRGEW